jgi:hypothetical protein
MPLDAARERLKGMSPANQRLHVLHHETLFDRTGLSMNLTGERSQRIVTEICIRKSIKLLLELLVQRHQRERRRRMGKSTQLAARSTPAQNRYSYHPSR